MNKYYYLIAFTALFFLSKSGYSQVLPANQPEQNACDALILCGDSFTTPYSYQGIGTISDLTTSPCSGGENNCMWLQLNVTAGGTIVFNIAPIDASDDYDFLVVDMSNTTCDNLSSSNVIRCNFNNNNPGSNINGQIGLNSTSTINNVTAGTTGDSYCQQITANAGDVYLIMINNFGNYSTGGPSSGFTISFTGSTAVFNSDGPPEIDSIGTQCDYSEGLSVYLSQEITCASIAGDASDFSLSPSGTITAVSGPNCSNGQGYTSVVNLTFSPPLPPGTYTLHPSVGTDGNTLLDLCSEPLSTMESVTFTVAPLPEYQTASIACSTITIQTNVPVNCDSIAANGSDFNISGPVTLNITAAQGLNCTNGYTTSIQLALDGPLTTAGTYIITSQNGTDGNTLTDTCGRPQNVGDTLSFTTPSLAPVTSLPDTLTTCLNTGIILPLEIVNPVQGVSYSYNWTPAGGLSSNTMQQPFALPNSDQTYIVAVSPDNPAFCTAFDTVFVNMLLGFDIVNNDTTVCSGASIGINVNGDMAYDYQWSPSTGVTNPNNPNTVITANQTTLYALTASYPGCVDSTQYFSITVVPSVFVELGDTLRICPGDSAIIESIVTPNTGNYTYTWTPSGAYSPQNTPNIFYYGDTTITLHMTAATASGCSGTDSVTIIVKPELTMVASTNDTGFCAGADSLQLSVSGGISFLWIPSYGLSSDTIANPKAAPATSTEYTVYAIAANGCRDTQTVMVSVYSQAIVSLPDSVTIYPGESYMMDPEGNCLYFSWFPPSGLSADNISNPIAQPEVRTRYFVTGITENGCATHDSIDVLVMQTLIDMPNTFVPGNGPNNIFKPSSRGIVKLNEFKVYNRWGQMVFSSIDINKGWDGTFNGKPQPVGVYVYSIDAVTGEGKPFVAQGNVTLLR